MMRSGPVHLPRHHGASTPAVTALAATVATAALVATTVVSHRGATDLLVAAASRLAVTVAALPARTVSATTTAAIVTGLGAPPMVTAR